MSYPVIKTTRYLNHPLLTIEVISLDFLQNYEAETSIIMKAQIPQAHINSFNYMSCQIAT